MRFQRVPRHIPVRAAIVASSLLSIVPSERIAPSSGHLCGSGSQSPQRTHQACQRFPECGSASLMRRLADVSQIVSGIPIIIAGGAVLVTAITIPATNAIAGSRAYAGSGLLQDTATMLLTGRIDAPSGRRDIAAAAAAVAMMSLLLVEMLLQLHVAQPPVHHLDQVLMHSLIVVRHRRWRCRCRW